MNVNRSHSFKHDLAILSVIWAISSICDRIWIALDRNPPSWDLAKHLDLSLTYWSFLQSFPQVLSATWWTNLWSLSEKYPPLLYVLTAPFLSLFGRNPDAALLVNLLFTGILIISTYGIGKSLFNREVGIWSAIVCVLMPRLYTVRLQYLLDYPLASLVAAAFCCLTLWKSTVEGKNEVKFVNKMPKSWFWISMFGVCFGLAMLIKQTTLFFLFFPIVYLGIKYLFKKAWLRIIQLSVGIFLGIFICGGWYRTNWLFVLSAFGNANTIPARLEGDPSLNTLEAWIYYWKDLPGAISWILLLVPTVGILLAIFRSSRKISIDRNWIWLGGYFVSAYLINSAFVNKDHRYIMPYLPAIAVFLGYGLTQWRYPWGRWIRWVTVSLCLALSCFNLYPIGGNLGMGLAQTLIPNSRYDAYLGKPWHLERVIEEVIKTEPYLRSSVGITISTPEVNEHNIDYYGNSYNFQVYGREMGMDLDRVEKDTRSLPWFIYKTGDEKRLSEARRKTAELVETGGNFSLKKSWQLPDNSTLKLYRIRRPFVEAKPLNEQISRVKLDKITVPTQAPPGKPIPVTYEWSGGWEELRSGLVLLTWKKESQAEGGRNITNNRWFHDRAIALGNLYSSIPIQAKDGFEIKENLAMLPPENIEAGTYNLEATYLNRVTGQSYSIDVPPATIEISREAKSNPSPELDLVTQIRSLAKDLPKGRQALDPIFSEVGRINQYDPIQDYLVQSEQTLLYRLQQEPNNLEFWYGLALSQALQQKVQPLIQTLKQVTQLDTNNPYAHAYLAFVYLYDWRGREADKALQPAIKINPELVEVKALGGIAAIMQGNLVKGWQTYQEIKPLL